MQVQKAIYQLNKLHKCLCDRKFSFSTVRESSLFSYAMIFIFLCQNIFEIYAFCLVFRNVLPISFDNSNFY